MTPKPFGYYGLNLDAETEQAIDKLELHELIDLADDMTNEMGSRFYIDNEEVELISDLDKPIFPHELSDLEKLGLIRGLCDRIEAKLLEATKQ